MGSQPTETFRVEERQQVEREEWVLNSPDPPALLHELLGSVKEIIFPHGNKGSSSTAEQATRRRAISFLKGLFPILSWGRDYNASKFKNDLMAGLTLASLSIPQVQLACLSTEQNARKCTLNFTIFVSVPLHYYFFFFAEYWIC